MARNRKARTVPVTSGAVRYKTKDIDALVAQLDTLDLSARNAFDDETEIETAPKQPFRFFALPSELRLRILEILVVKGNTIDLDPTNARTLLPSLRLFYVSRRMHAEASHVFYAQNTFRVFAIHGRFFHTKKQLLTRLPPHYIVHLRTLELRLGPGWTKPPKSWVANEKLHLEAAVNVRTLKVFVECDPAGHPSFEGFRNEECGAAEAFYTTFSVGLLKGLFERLNKVRRVEFDAYPSVARTSPLVQALVRETRGEGKEVGWGVERGWNTIVDLDLGGMMGKLGL